MNFKECLEHSGVKRTGNFYDDKYENLDNIIGKQYWICDYRLNKDKSGKPIRNVAPKLVQVFSNDDLPKNKNVYYSPIHFRAVNNRKVNSTVIAPFDNTGYRGYTGVSVNIFENEEDCRECFAQQCRNAIKEYSDELDRRTSEIHNKIQEIEKLIADNENTTK